jgi:hypothetical protein
MKTGARFQTKGRCQPQRPFPFSKPETGEGSEQILPMVAEKMRMNDAGSPSEGVANIPSLRGTGVDKILKPIVDVADL